MLATHRFGTAIHICLPKVNFFEPGQFRTSQSASRVWRYFSGIRSFHFHCRRKGVVSRVNLFEFIRTIGAKFCASPHRKQAGWGAPRRSAVTEQAAGRHRTRPGHQLSRPGESHTRSASVACPRRALSEAHMCHARARVDSITGQLCPPVGHGYLAFTACRQYEQRAVATTQSGLPCQEHRSATSGRPAPGQSSERRRPACRCMLRTKLTGAGHSHQRCP
jgi:hypothetical protein